MQNIDDNLKPILAIVVPCYNEEEVLNITNSRLLNIISILIKKDKISEESYILYVDDGSLDNTWTIMQDISLKNKAVKGIKLSTNKGHQSALWAGMEHVKNKCDCMISIDADLQDDEYAIINMIDEFKKGFDIVYGVRSKRDQDSSFKKVTAEGFYKLMKFLGVDIVFNHADYRCLSSNALINLLNYKENNLFIRALIPSITKNSTIIKYERKERFAGESKYPFSKMLSFAIDGITSFSVVPLRIITVSGFILFIFSIIMGIYVLYLALFTDQTIPGWASTVLPIYFIGGVQVLFLGIVGEYIGKIYKETKKRPRYFIEDKV